MNELLLANADAINQFATRVHRGLDSAVPATPFTSYFGFDTPTCTAIAAAVIAEADGNSPNFIFGQLHHSLDAGVIVAFALRGAIDAARPMTARC